MTQQLEQQFVSFINGIEQSITSLTTNFNALTDDVQAMEKSVTAANKYSSNETYKATYKVIEIITIFFLLLIRYSRWYIF